jgi:hypothetical protein
MTVLLIDSNSCRLTPRTDEFFTLFGRAGENALQVARLVERRFSEHPNSEVTQERVKAEETDGDNITRELITLLNTHYITPFDRDDIFQLSTVIDDVVDHLEEASDLLGLYDVEMRSRHAVEQCRVIVRACEQLAIACENLKGMRGVQDALVEHRPRAHLLLDHLIAEGLGVHHRVYKNGLFRGRERVRALTTADKVMVNARGGRRHTFSIAACKRSFGHARASFLRSRRNVGRTSLQLWSILAVRISGLRYAARTRFRVLLQLSSPAAKASRRRSISQRSSKVHASV